ncbi:pentatricopeptide repeat-containing protein At3g12770 [Amborella trichopoda]|uniref:Uncharacterized protein n=1 Tax=Amborella trichopoda TaxID=13333 RepID=U5D6A9_AMBTC|nr:pentatricopeptide repeat-containing protein At3g12770 [Amborella trichopoda]ERN15893.1 hypothetical protein AMTR_s00039p00210570 [Amborella trichopoda]|eukprot:XP_006854426.1 pentatricopeptide repeat-containing protein At3g12770 [Amborella trichopoda]
MLRSSWILGFRFTRKLYFSRAISTTYVNVIHPHLIRVRSLQPLNQAFAHTSDQGLVRKHVLGFRYFMTATLEPSATSIDDLLAYLRHAIGLRSLQLARQAHALVWILGFAQNQFISVNLITVYSTCNKLSDARLVFDTIQWKNIFLWNSIISAYVKYTVWDEPLILYDKLLNSDVRPDHFTFSSVLKICAELCDSLRGEKIRVLMEKTGFCSDVVALNALIVMYCKCEWLTFARKVFDEMPDRNIASWNAMISGYAKLGSINEVWELVRQMHLERVILDGVTVVQLLSLCNNKNLVFPIHAVLLRIGLDLDFHIGSCLIDTYAKLGKLAISRRVHELMQCRNVVTWTSMVAGYAQNGYSYEALEVFREMQSIDTIKPNKVSLVSVLPACIPLGDLTLCKQIHGFSIRNQWNSEISLSNSLIDAYSKLGCLDHARCVFDDICYEHDVISWSSMIVGYSLNGLVKEPMLLFDEMIQLGIKPDNITFVGILSACARARMIEKGMEYYNLMTTKYGMVPTMEVCSCVVDMLGRNGQLNRALDFIKSMSIDEPGPSVWGALFSASLLHENVEMGKLASKYLLELEPQNPAHYVSLSNVYAASGIWDGVSEVRLEMKERGLRKLPGYSWIIVNSKVHSFYVSDKSHPSSSLIYAVLDRMILEMKGAGYAPEIKCLSQDAC